MVRKISSPTPREYLSSSDESIPEEIKQKPDQLNADKSHERVIYFEK